MIRFSLPTPPLAHILTIQEVVALVESHGTSLGIDIGTYLGYINH